MMKKLFFILAVLFCTLWGCNKNGVDDPTEPENPENPAEVTLTLSVSDLVFDAKGGWQEFTIDCPAAWTITGGNAWCQPGATSGSGKSQIKVLVEASTLTSDRNVNLTVKAGTLKVVLSVTQKGMDALTLSKDKFEVAQEGGDFTVEVKSNMDYMVSIPTTFSGWLKQSPQSKAMTAKNYRFTVSANEGKEKRNGYVVFSGNSLKDTVHVYQPGKPDEEDKPEKGSLILSESTCTLTAKAQELTVELKTNIDYEVVVPDSVVGWISHLTTKAVRTDKLHFSIAENEGETARTAVVIVKERDGVLSDTLHVIQKSQEYFYLAADEIRVGPYRQEIPDFVVSNVELSFSKYPNWLSISRGGGRYSLYIGENKSPDAREGIMVVKEKDGNWSDTLSVYQACGVGLEQKEYRIEKEGGTLSIEIAVAYDAIIPDFCSQWITQVESEVTDVRRLVFAVSANETDTMRNGVILLKNERDEFTDTLKICQLQDIQIVDLNFKEYLLKNFDTNKDGEIDFLEAEKIIKIDLRSTKYFSLEGIQYFRNLTELILNPNEVLLSLDLSKNVELKKLDCQDNSLSALDLSHNTKLYDLNCSRNNLSTLDLSNNPDLTCLYCYSNKLTSIDLSNNRKLRSLGCSYNKLTSLDLSDVPDISWVACECNQLTSLYLPNNQELDYLSCGENQLQTLDLSNAPKVSTVHCHKNQLTSIHLPNNQKLNWLDCYNNRLQSLDLSNASNVSWVSCENNQLTSLHLPNNQKLDRLDCYNNRLQSLDLSNAPNVSAVDCKNNQLITLYLPNNSNLKELECNKNLLGSLDLPNNPKLKTLKCDSCRLKTLTLNCAILYKLDCSNNQLQTLDLSNTPKVSTVSCYKNQLTSLHLPNNQSLRDLSCGGNQLQSLDLSGAPNVSEVGCSNNQLTSLHLSNNTNLKLLYCDENQLQSLDLSNNTNLERLSCWKNKMITIDISHCSSKCSLSCYYMPTLKTVYKKSSQSVSADSGVEILIKE